MNIFIAGHNGMVGSAIAKKLNKDFLKADRKKLDLRDTKKDLNFQSYKNSVYKLSIENRTKNKLIRIKRTIRIFVSIIRILVI